MALCAFVCCSEDEADFGEQAWQRFRFVFFVFRAQQIGGYTEIQLDRLEFGNSCSVTPWIFYKDNNHNPIITQIGQCSRV